MTAALRVGRDAAGEFTLEAGFVAARFGWPEEKLQDYTRRGLVHSRVERGEGEDQGTWRLSVRCGNRRWQAIVDGEGAVLSESLDMVSARR